MESRKFPTVARYLERLPNGIDSHPHELSKAALYVHALESLPLALSHVRAELPQPIVSLIERPLPVTEWVSSVHFHCIMLAIRDAHFNDLESHAAWIYQRNLALLSTPLYKMLFLVVSPERLLVGAEQRWRAFRRGCSLEIVEKRERDVRLRLVFAERLFELNSLRGVGEALRAAIDAAGARESRVEVDHISEREARYRLQWNGVTSVLSRVF